MTTTAPSAESQQTRAKETCPRCHTTQDWGHSSWCPVCSYYPVADEGAADGRSWADDLPEVEQEEQLDDRHPLLAIPGWFWIMMGGILGIVVFSVSILLAFPEEDGPRGTIALIQLAVGFASFAVAHGLACKKAFALDRRLNPMDILLGWVLIWQPAVQELPKSSRRIWGLVWGVVGMLTAVTIIGGIDYSAPFRAHTESPLKDVNPLKAVGAVAKVAAASIPEDANQPASMEDALGKMTDEFEESGLVDAGMLDQNGQPASMEDALGGFTEEVGATGVLDAVTGMTKDGKAAELLDAAKSGELSTEDVAGTFFDQPQQVEAWVYGIEIDAKRMPTAFLFAAEVDGEDRHVARVETKSLPRDKFRSIALKLQKAVQKTPAIPTERKAIWVKQLVWCELETPGYDENNEMIDPSFNAVIIHQRGIRD